MKKLLSFVLVLALVLGLSVVPSFADSSVRPTSHTAVSSIAGINSVTVNGVAAYYEYDDNTGNSTIYIRAMMPSTVSLEDLQDSTVVIVTSSGSPTLDNTSGSLIAANTYEFTHKNLLNNRYTVSVGGNTYYLAAGFQGRVAVSSSDLLGITSVTIGSTPMNVYGTVAQSAYVGNEYYILSGNPWTNTGTILYYVTGPYNGSGSSASMSMTLNNGSSVASGGCLQGRSSPYTYNFSLGNTFSVTNNNTSRQYKIVNTSAAGSYRASSSNYVIDFYELQRDFGDDYDSVIGEILDALELFYGDVDYNDFTESNTVMDVMLAFISFAEDNNLFSDDSYCSSSYLSTLDGLGEFSAGSYSGWMYMDDEYDEYCAVPMVAASDYYLGDADLFTWFFTTDFTDHYMF